MLKEDGTPEAAENNGGVMPTLNFGTPFIYSTLKETRLKCEYYAKI